MKNLIVLLLFFILSFMEVKSQIDITNLMGWYKGTYNSSYFTITPYPHWVYTTDSLTVNTTSTSDTTFTLSWSSITRNCILYNDSTFHTDNTHCGNGKFGFDDIWFCDGGYSAFGGGMNFHGKKSLIGFEELFINNFSIFPNPFNKELTINRIQFQENITEASLMDLTGKVMLYGTISESQSKLNTEEISPGFYLLKLSNGKNVAYLRLVKLYIE